MSHLSEQVLALRVATLYQKRALSTGEDTEETSGNKGRVPPRWKEWLDATQQGGKRMVPNPSPNPLSRERHRQVSFSTALKNKDFYKKAIEAYQHWVEKTESKEKPKEKPEAKPTEDKGGKPTEEAKPEEHGEHGEEPKKSWKDRIKELGSKAKDFIEKAPKDVKKFLEDEGHRRKVVLGIHKALVDAPEKLVKSAIQTVKDEVKEYKEAGQGVAAVLKGKKMSTHQKKAFKKVALHLAISIAASAVIGSGVLGVAGAFAKGTVQTIAMKSVSKALGHVSVLQEIGHIGHGVAEFITHLASTGSPLFMLYRYASQVKSGAEPDVDEVMGNFMAANVAKELETFGSDDDVEASLKAMDDEGTEEEPEEDLDEEEPSEEESTEEVPPSDGENIVKVDLKDVSEIWFVKNQEGSEKMANDPVREFEDAVIVARVYQRFSATEEPNFAVRRMAYDRAKELAENKNKEYYPPLVKAAKAYFDALDKTVTEEKRHELASELMTEVEAHIAAAGATVRILTRYNQVFQGAAADHNRLAQVE